MRARSIIRDAQRTFAGLPGLFKVNRFNPPSCPGAGYIFTRVSASLAGFSLLLGTFLPASGAHAADLIWSSHEFSFARLVYSGSGEGGWPRWQADWPEAEHHFTRGLRRLTRIDVDLEGRLVDFSNDDIFDYPWLYAVEVGALTLNLAEAAKLREYLLRGGFLMVDDFHGVYQWQQFAASMKKVFPGRPIVDMEDDTEIFHMLYELGEREQIPGIRPLMNNRTSEYGGTVERWRGIFDDNNRIMVAINFNMDLGDAWEHADDSRYPAAFSAMAYRIGTNYVLYALTH